VIEKLKLNPDNVGVTGQQTDHSLNRACTGFKLENEDGLVCQLMTEFSGLFRNLFIFGLLYKDVIILYHMYTVLIFSWIRAHIPKGVPLGCPISLFLHPK